MLTPLATKRTSSRALVVVDIPATFMFFLITSLGEIFVETSNVTAFLWIWTVILSSHIQGHQLRLSITCFTCWYFYLVEIKRPHKFCVLRSPSTWFKMKWPVTPSWRNCDAGFQTGFEPASASGLWAKPMLASTNGMWKAFLSWYLHTSIVGLSNEMWQQHN